jgi:DUF4097 and DUF4098 domain-containing protein YvlB
MRAETFSTPGPVGLDVRVPAGRIEIETAEADQTVVELEPLRDDEASVAAVEDARVEGRERAAGGHEVTVEIRDAHGRFGFGRGAEVLARISCPHGTALDVETGSADVEAHGRYADAKVASGSGDVELERVDGEAAVNSASGDVEIEEVGGRVRVNTASGDVRVEQPRGGGQVNTASGDVAVEEAGGPLVLQTASGDVVVRRAGDSLTVKTASGDHRVDSVRGGEVMLQSASGDIHVGVERGTKLWLDLQSRSGETASDLEVGDMPPVEGAPVLELRASSMSGDIHVGRA